MKLSIATCATEQQITAGEKVFDPATGIRQCAEAGFSRIDFNFAKAAQKGDRPLTGDGYLDWAKAMRAVADEAGVTAEQTHAHWFYIEDQSSPDVAWNMEMLRRSVEASAVMGDRPWVVTHPLSLADAEGYNEKKTRRFLLDLYGELGDLAAKCGVRIAMENLFPGGMRFFGCCPEDLLWLMEELNDPLFGICWDFGHANRAKLDHVPALRAVAPYLRVTHVHDNKGVSDDHFMPYFGNIPWKEILPEVGRIGYTGNWNFEVHVFYHTMPQSLRLPALRFLRETGEAMLAQM